MQGEGMYLSLIRITEVRRVIAACGFMCFAQVLVELRTSHAAATDEWLFLSRVACARISAYIACAPSIYAALGGIFATRRA
jgi:hypothetical protein